MSDKAYGTGYVGGYIWCQFFSEIGPFCTTLASYIVKYKYFFSEDTLLGCRASIAQTLEWVVSQQNDLSSIPKLFF